MQAMLLVVLPLAMPGVVAVGIYLFITSLRPVIISANRHPFHDEAMSRLVDHQLQKVCHGSAHDHCHGGSKRLRAVDGQDQALHAAAVWSLTR